MLKTLEEKLNTARQDYYNLDGNLERCNSEIKLNSERINNLNQNIQRVDGELQEFNHKLDEISKEETVKHKRTEYFRLRRILVQDEINREYGIWKGLAGKQQ